MVNPCAILDLLQWRQDNLLYHPSKPNNIYKVYELTQLVNNNSIKLHVVLHKVNSTTLMEEYSNATSNAESIVVEINELLNNYNVYVKPETKENETNE